MKYPEVSSTAALALYYQGTSRFLAEAGADAPPPWRSQGEDFEVKEGHPDFLQITCFFLNAVLLLYLKLFTCLEIITMFKLS